MSESFQLDPILARQQPEPQPKGFGQYDAAFRNIQWLTPIGRVLQCHLDAPFSVPDQSGNPGNPKYSVQLAFGPQVVGELWDACCFVADQAWPDIERADPQTGEIIHVPGSHMFQYTQQQGGYHFPIYTGDDLWQRDPKNNEHYRGTYFINASMNPVTRNSKPQKPLLFDQQQQPVDASLFYRGCYARSVVQIAAFDNRQYNRRGVGIYVKWAQFAGHGKEIQGGFNALSMAASVFAGASPLPAMEQAPQEVMTGPQHGVQRPAIFGPRQPIVQPAAAGMQGGGGFRPNFGGQAR